MNRQDRKIIAWLMVFILIISGSLYGITSSAQTTIATPIKVWIRVSEGTGTAQIGDKLDYHFRAMRGIQIVDEEEDADLKVHATAAQSTTIEKFYKDNGEERGSATRHQPYWSIAYTFSLRTKHKDAVILAFVGLMNNVSVDEMDAYCKQIAKEADDKIIKPIRRETARK